MTYLEANALVDDFSFVYKGKSIPKEALIECREVIHKALKKQIPRKPKNYLVNMKCIDFLCPNCKKKIISKVDGEWVAGKKQQHCDNCGQALDWSERNG
jgi:hypothetical protein